MKQRLGANSSGTNDLFHQAGARIDVELGDELVDPFMQRGRTDDDDGVRVCVMTDLAAGRCVGHQRLERGGDGRGVGEFHGVERRGLLPFHKAGHVDLFDQSGNSFLDLRRRDREDRLAGSVQRETPALIAVEVRDGLEHEIGAARAWVESPVRPY